MTAIHQLVPSLAERDAVGQHALQVQRLLREQGIASDILTEHEPAPSLRKVTRSYRSFGTDPSDVGATLLYQSSTGSTIVDWLVQRPEPVVVNYHNVTPAEFFAKWEPVVAEELRVGRSQTAELAPLAELGIADSAYNAEELDAVGYSSTTVVPILLDYTEFDHPADPFAVDALRSAKAQGGADWLFVGRLAPNKCQHDLIKALAYYRAAFDPAARLTLVGRSSSAAYSAALRDYVAELGLEDAVRFPASVTPGELTAFYQQADVFVCASEHEGFCVPLLEAMYHRLPVVAYGAAAVPATLGTGGLVAESKAPAVIAEAVARVVHDRGLREQLVASGTDRLAAFDLERTRAAMLTALEPYLR